MARQYVTYGQVNRGLNPSTLLDYYTHVLAPVKGCDWIVMGQARA